VISETEYELLLEQCRALPPAEGNYLVDDYIENLLLTVLDYQNEILKLTKAMDYFRTRRREEIRELADLLHLLLKYPDDKKGNMQAARYLWNNYSWNRAALLRRLSDYFADAGITSQERLKAWAQDVTYQEFKGQVPGMGYVLYQRMIMRLGIEALKPETHVIDFANSVIDRYEADHADIADKLTAAAGQLGIPAYELDRRIWNHQMGIISSGQMKARG
jgi:hypothetical protein